MTHLDAPTQRAGDNHDRVGSGMPLASGLPAEREATYEPRATPTTTDFANSRRAARTQLPATRTGIIVRQTLVQRFAAVSDDTPLITVVAPAGYGKTTALSQWAHTCAESFGWVQVEPGDGNPLRLLRDIALALHRIQPLDDALWRVLADRDPTTADTAVSRLLLWIRALRRPVVLVLDDVQFLNHTSLSDVVLALAGGLPSGCHLVLAGRRRPRIRLGRLRSQGGCAEFTAADLAFSATEAAAFLRQVGVEQTETAQTLVERTEGWPAGIYLAVLALRGRGTAETAAAIKTISGLTPYIAEYFREEILSRQSAEHALFLLRTSVLEHMSGPLCDAVLDTSGSSDRLAEMQASNLFIAVEDEHGQWYRYHRLFTEMLIEELRRLKPGEDARLCSRAEKWFESRGLPEPAVEYALAARNTRTAGRLIAAQVQRLHSEGRLGVARRWLKDFPDVALEEYPPCALAAVWAWAFSGDPARAGRCLQIAVSRPFDGDMPDGSASFASAVTRARATLSPDGMEAMLADAERAVELEPPGGPWHPMSRAILGSAHVLTGSTDEAVLSFERAIRFGGDVQSPGVSLSLAQLALISADQGDWSSAACYADTSHRLMTPADLHGDISSLLVYAARARISLRRGNLMAAKQDLENALQLYRDPSPRAFLWLGAQSAIVLGRILLDMRERSSAQRKANDAARYLASLGSAGVLTAWLQDLEARLKHACHLARATAAAQLTPAEARILQLLPTHLSMSEIAQTLIVSTNTVKSQVAAVYRKLGAASRTEAVHRAWELGLLEPWPVLLPPLPDPRPRNDPPE